MRRIFAISILALFGVLFWTPDVGAGVGKIYDPANDVFNKDKQSAGSGKIDILGVDFSDDGHTATYTIHTKSGFNTSDIHAIWVNLQDLEGLAQYDCPQLAAWAKYVGDRLEPKLTHCLGSGSGTDGGPGGTKEYGGVVMSHADGDKKITVTVDIDVLRAAGFTGPGYNFNVVILQAGKQSIQDQAPNPYLQRHELVYVNPEPTAASPETPSPKATAEPGRTDESASLAASQQNEPPGGAGVPIPVIAVVGGLAAIGAGLGFYRFWPRLSRHL